MNVNKLKRLNSLNEILKKKKMFINIENLPNELWYEIFSYMNILDLYQAFSNLNRRFQHLLITSFVKVKIDYSSSSKFDLQYFYKYIIESNSQKIVSLYLKDIWNDTSIFTMFSINTSFTHLKSLSIHGIKSCDVLSRLSDLISLPRLYSLTLDIENSNNTDSEDFSHIYQFIFGLTTLKYAKIRSKMNVSFNSLNPNRNIQLTTIKYLNIQHSCKLNDLLSILFYTPHLCHLICQEIIGSIKNINRISLSLDYLIHLSIKKFHLQFNIFEQFIKKISSQLQLLRMTTYQDESYLDADRWEQLIREHLPNLDRFYFDHKIFIHGRFILSPYYQNINRFISTFWIEHGWIFQLEIDIEHNNTQGITCSIHSNKKKQWYELSEFLKINSNLNEENNNLISTQHSQNIQLTLIVPSYNTCEILLTDNIISLFTLMQVTHLEIPYNAIFISILINLIRLLPDLNSLSVWCLALLTPRYLSVNEVNTLRLISNKNKIIKVNIRWMTALAQLQFLIDLCPSMQYLEIDCSNSTNFQLLIRFILMENMKYLPNLHLLCLSLQKVNDKIMKKFQGMIKSEKLSLDYRIKGLDNKIYLQRQ